MEAVDRVSLCRTGEVAVAAAGRGVSEPEAVRGRPAWDVRAQSKRGRHPCRGVGVSVTTEVRYIRGIYPLRLY